MRKCYLSLIMAMILIVTMVSGCAEQVPTVKTEPIAPAETEQTTFTYADTIKWDGEYDVIVVGFGGAGAVSATYASMNGAKVLLTEKAPEGHEGGNTRLCGQLIATGEDYKKTRAYYDALTGEIDIPDAVIDTYVKGIVDVKNILTSAFKVEKTISGKEHPIAKYAIPEYPELPGAETIDMVLVSEGMSNAALWNTFKQGVTDNSDSIDVWYEAPGKHLIQDPKTKTILGVQIEKQGKLVNIRAKNGVVLTTGGFENNQQMIQDYLGVDKVAVAGTFYNTGDGIKMAQEVGADLWHMDVWETSGCYGGTTFVPLEGEHTLSLTSYAKWINGSYFVAADDGSRFVREDFKSRHGHVPYGNTWKMTNYPAKMFLFYDQAQSDKFDELVSIPDKYKPQIIKADTLEGLAEKTGMKNIAKNVSLFNECVERGEDTFFGRDIATMNAIGDGPYYAAELLPRMLNTQGGPRKNENAEVIDTNGNPIPHLYIAGELGGVTAHLYQGGGNNAESLVFGKIAGTNAAKVKEPLPDYNIEKIESTLIYTLGNDPDKVQDQEIELEENELIGVGTGGMGGEVIVKVKMDGTKIDAIEIVKHMETKGICEKAIEQIPLTIIEKQTVEVDAVSGATMTSNGIKNAVADALSKVK